MENKDGKYILSPEEYTHLLQGSQDSRNTNVTLNSKYRVKFEKAASANKIDGFVVEANGDNIGPTMSEAVSLYINALKEVEMRKPVVAPANGGK